MSGSLENDLLIFAKDPSNAPIHECHPSGMIQRGGI